MTAVLDPQARFEELRQCADEGLTVDQTAARMGVRASDIYPVKWVLGLQFRNAFIGNRNGTRRDWNWHSTKKHRRPTDPSAPAATNRRLPQRHYQPAWDT